MKILFLFIIVIGSTYIGWGVSNYYKIRNNFFKDFLNFLEFCETQITFYQNKIDEIFENYFELSSKSKELEKFLKKIKVQFDSGKMIKAENIFLFSNEQKLLNNFFNGLGKTNAEKQRELIEFNKSQFNSIAKESAEKVQKFAPICVRLGFLFGLAVAICLI